MEGLLDLGIETMALDVTDITAIRQVWDKIAIKMGGKLDILVNNTYVAVSTPKLWFNRFQGTVQVVSLILFAFTEHLSI